jgi:hypothetical protein
MFNPPMAGFLLPLCQNGKGISMGFLIVFLGGGGGCCCCCGGGVSAAVRHGVNLVVARLFGTSFPLSRLLINITGSILMGLAAGYFAFKSGGS